ncbi:KU80 [Auxenochlorella protothecoides x Auxenochlorella symbiontica]|uniref:Ku domain-containing protein n=1 Tax=Auxenochlorella protothecoides TaxID=3075 RepID=A0A1D2AH75_AUXPR
MPPATRATGPRNVEVTVLLLDIGASMHADLDSAAHALSAYVETRMLSRPNSDLALVYFGTSGTSNELHDEAASAGDPTQYLHISVVHALQQPGLSMLRSLRQVPRGDGESDFVDALTVALDSLYKAVALRDELQGPRVAKRIVLLSQLATQIKPDPGNAFKDTLVRKLAQQGVTLDLVCLHPYLAVPGTRAQLQYILDNSPHTLREVHDAAELAGAFKSREVTATAFYSGPFTISEDFEFKVKVAKKTNQEKLPSLGKESPFDSTDPAASHGLTLAREYRVAEEGDAGEEVAQEERVKVYRYGKQLVPVSSEEERYLKYAVSRGLSLLGFVDAASIPRHHYMKECWVVVADKASPTALAALAALAAAAHKRDQVAIVRYVPRAGGAIHVCAAAPVPAARATPAHLLLNVLPFAEDVRDFRFPGFDRPERKPGLRAAQAALDLVRAGALQEGPRERLVPEHVANPSLHAFLRLVANKALGVEPGADPGPDALRSALEREGLPGSEPGLAKACAELRSAAGLGGPRRALGRSPSQRLRPELAIQDMHAALGEEGAAQSLAALRGMHRHILELMRGSPGDRDVDAAVECAAAMREAASQHFQPDAWNSFLKDARKGFLNEAGKSRFLTDMQEAGLTPLGPARGGSESLRDSLGTEG